MKQSLPIESERQNNNRSHLAISNASPVSQAFVDDRESTALQRQLMAKMANSPQAIAQRKLSEQMNNSPRMLAQRQQIAKMSGNAVQRMEGEEEPMQGKFDTAQLEQAPAEKANNTGLPDNLKQGIENLSGMSMDNVKVHYNSSEPAQLNALAYAQGTDIHVGAGQEKHLPHEAWHVVQQAQGRVKPTMQMREGVPVNDDQALEQEADVMGAKAVAGVVQARQKSGSSIESDLIGSAPKPVQLAMQYGNTHTLLGAQGSVHWHYSYDDANENSMHLTIADTQNYNNRTWASRQSYAPTGRNAGDWTNWVNNHGHTPAWATTLAGNQGRNPAEQAFHADQNIAALLVTAFPQAPVNIQDQNAFPPLGG